MDEPRYVLGNKIASGGMAEIYLGKQISKDGFERVCAIKKILPHLSRDKDFIDMFRDEAHICKKLQHTNIVRIEGFEDIDSSFAIIMEFIDGSDLRSILSACERSKTKLSMPMILFIATEAARGLHYAHTKKDDITRLAMDIVHRDISPQNILVSYEGEVKVTDFGIANAKNKNTETMTGTVKGKYSYMSPEQILAKKVDCRSDIFSLGIVLWEMLAMRKLFQSRNDVSTIGRVRECRIPFSLGEKNKEISPELEQIVMKCLAKDTKDRYQTAERMEKDLRKFQYTNYPDFTAGDLGKFIKQRLVSRRKQMQKHLKAMLTKNSNPAASQARTPPASRDTAAVFPAGGELILNTPPARSKQAVGTDYDDSYDNEYDTLSQNKPIKKKTASAFSVPKIRDMTESPRISYGNEAAVASYPRRKHRKKRSKVKGGPVLLITVMGVAILTLAVFIAKNKTSLRVSTGNFLQLRLDTTPSTVKISINGRKYQNGQYLQTPLTLKSKPGRHIVKIFRQGYKVRKFEYQGRKGQLIEKTLVLDSATHFSPVRIVSSNKHKKYLLDVNSGFFRGNSPALIPDLAFNKRHTVKVLPKGRSRKSSFTCSFVPTSYSKTNPYILIITTRRCIGRPQ